MLRSKLFLLCISAVVVFVSSSLVREHQRRRAIQREIDAIAAEVERLEQQRQRLTDLLELADTPEFLEREARLRLGLQQPGETVLIVPDDGAGFPGSGDTTQTVTPPSNWRKWWEYIFE